MANPVVHQPRRLNGAGSLVQVIRRRRVRSTPSHRESLASQSQRGADSTSGRLLFRPTFEIASG